MQSEYPNGKVAIGEGRPFMERRSAEAASDDDQVVAEALFDLIRAIRAEKDPKARKEIKREAAKLIHAL